MGAPNPTSAARDSFYRLQSGNRSNESLDSQALLDHRYWTAHIDSDFPNAMSPNSKIEIVGLFKLAAKVYSKASYLLEEANIR